MTKIAPSVRNRPPRATASSCLHSSAPFFPVTHLMAEPIGIASGLLALATFAFESSISLYNTIRSFQSHQTRVRDLIEELEALSGVLGHLNEIASNTTDINLSTLHHPVLRCGKACNEFEQVILKCLSRSGGNKTSFRDWAKLRYMGDDIDHFKRLLAGYKLTISIALTDANLRQSSATAESLESYKDLVKTATDDLEAHLQSIEEKLEVIFKQNATDHNLDGAELKLIEEEKLSTQMCLQICAQLSEHIDQIQILPNRGGTSSTPVDASSLPERVTNEGLQECKRNLVLTAAKLEKYMRDIMDRLVTKSKTNMTSQDDVMDLARLQEEWETTRQSINICTRAERHLKDNVSSIENYATGDAIQFMVSTNGKILHGRNQGLGWRSKQVGGYLDDISLRQLSRDMLGMNLQNSKKHGSSSRSNTSPTTDSTATGEPISDFKNQYGRGFKLSSMSNPDLSKSPTGASGDRTG